MWMLMECQERGQELKMSTDPLRSRTKLRPLMPRPTPRCSANSTVFSATPTTPRCLHSPNIPTWNHPPSGYGVRRETSTVPVVSSRWNPTREQLQALEEMYRRGTRTPSAEQIQQIAAKLRRFGKIEGKNVFYWFQNRKARERQKKRRHEMELLANKMMRHIETPERRQSGSSSRYSDIEHPKKSPTPSNCNTDLEYSASMHGAAVVEELHQKDEWAQLDREELQKQTIAANRTETNRWQLELSSCMPPNNHMHKITAQRAPGQENAKPFVAFSLSKQLPPENDDFTDLENGAKENRTLPLFPVKGNDLSTLTATEGGARNFLTVGTTLAPNQFFEFLPAKN